MEKVQLEDDVKEFPKSLFRYRSASTDYFLEELSQAVNFRKIYLAGASDLNDPFDFCPIYEASELSGVVKDLKRSHGRKPMITRERYQRLVGRPITKGQFKAETRMLRPSVYAAKLELKVSEKVFIDLPRKSRVACFSESGQNIPMWAHYSAGHCGVCIEYSLVENQFQSSDHVPLSVTYQNLRPKVTTITLRGFTGRNMHPKEIKNKEMKVFEAMFLTKSDQWKYEKEWRVFDSSDMPPGYVKIPCLIPKSIFFGVKASLETKKRVEEICKDKIQLFDCFVSSDSFELARKVHLIK